MDIILTSFQRLGENPEVVARTPRYSSARWQPKGWSLPEVDWMKPAEDGRPIYLRYFSSPEKYFEYMYTFYNAQRDEIQAWLDAHQDEDLIFLACWCPYSRTSKKQIEQHGTFVCHLEPIRAILEEEGVNVRLDQDRIDHLYRWPKIDNPEVSA